nr:iron ABC transporter permease [Lolliginicoccus lacisalsi]
MVFFAWPVIAILRRGLTGPDGGPDPLGAARILAEPGVWGIAGFTIGQALASTLLTLLAGLPVAWLLARVALPGRLVLRIAVTVPFVLPTVVVGILFRVILAPQGPLGFLGLDGTVWAILLAHVFFNIAVIARTVGSVWSTLDRRAEQAARTLGATPFQAWRTVTLPALRPAILSASAIVFLFCATSFGVVLVLGGSRYRTLETEIYLQTVQAFDLRAAAALSILQMLTIGAAILIATLARRGRRSDGQAAMASGQQARPRGAQWVPVALVLGVVAALLVAPPLLLAWTSVRRGGSFTLEGYRLLLGRGGDHEAWGAMLMSLRTATDAAVLATVLGVLAAVAITAARGRWAIAGEAALLAPLGISAVTVGFGLFITLGQLPVDLRSSPLVIPIAQALIAIPLVVRVLLPALRAVDPRLREGARVLGASPARVWASIDLPLAWRSLAVAAGFAFIVSLGEFGATSFLARAGEPTLPVLIGRLISRPGAESYSVAMAGAVALLVLTAAVIAVVEIVRVGEIGEF